LLSNVSPQVRDGLVCAVAYLVFAKNIEAVASLFGELQLLPDEVLNDPSERQALNSAMEITMAEALVYEPLLDGSGTTNIPILKFDKLLDALSRLVPRFRFQLPPYFINNARALSTLEGIARSLDPKFNVFQVMYPFALNRLLANPTKSPVVDKTLQVSDFSLPHRNLSSDL
jgi:predicted unusual protein kinase regulating ubiquinone biosynthesis (AarF/ABC1/UbiB family)